MTTPQYGSDAPRKLPLQELGQAKRDGRPLVMITAYGTIAGVLCMLLVLLMYVVRSGSNL